MIHKALPWFANLQPKYPPTGVSGSFALMKSRSSIFDSSSGTGDYFRQLPPPAWDDETHMLVLKVRMDLGMEVREGQADTDIGLRSC